MIRPRIHWPRIHWPRIHWPRIHWPRIHWPRIHWLDGVVAAGAVSLAVCLSPASALAQDIAYFRIGAGSPGSTLYDLAGQIAGAISNPPGSRQCDNDGPCGVEGLIGIAQTTMRPAEGLQSVEDRMVESAIVSAD